LLTQFRQKGRAFKIVPPQPNFLLLRIELLWKFEVCVLTIEVAERLVAAVNQCQFSALRAGRDAALIHTDSPE
jgi:hypothetical protein